MAAIFPGLNVLMCGFRIIQESNIMAASAQAPCVIRSAAATHQPDHLIMVVAKW